MATQVYTFKVTYEGCKNKIWRVFEVSSNYDLASLGYAVLASFDTMAYHLFNIKHRGIVYETAIEYWGDSPLLQDTKLSKLKLESGEHMQMHYDFGCDQIFDIEFIGSVDMLKGKGTSYPKVVDGAGRGIIDDMHVSELMKIIRKTDKNGKSDFVIENKYGVQRFWDYRDYDMFFDNCLLKGAIARIRDGYECEE